MNEEKLNERLQRIEVDHLELMGGQTALVRQYEDLSRAQKKTDRCFAEYRALYGDSIKASAADRAFVQGIKDRFLKRAADAIAWGFALMVLVSLGAGALYFLRPWFRYLFNSSA